MGVDEGYNLKHLLNFKKKFLLNHQASARNNFHDIKIIYVTT